MEYFDVTGDFIELNKLLKVMNLVASGGEANALISGGMVRVNGQVETRKRNKIVRGMVVSLGPREVTVR